MIKQGYAVSDANYDSSPRHLKEDKKKRKASAGECGRVRLPE